MVHIISDRQSDWVKWFGEVISRLEKYKNVSQLLIVANVDNVDDDGNSHVIEFMNCNTDDVYYYGGIIQKEAIKHEMIEELGIEDDSWFEEEDD